MTKETIKTECGLDIIGIVYHKAPEFLGAVKSFANEKHAVELVRTVWSNHFFIAVLNSKREGQEVILIDGTEAEAIEEFEAVCNRFKTEPTNWGWKGKA